MPDPSPLEVKLAEVEAERDIVIEASAEKDFGIELLAWRIAEVEEENERLTKQRLTGEEAAWLNVIADQLDMDGHTLAAEEMRAFIAGSRTGSATYKQLADDFARLSNERDRLRAAAQTVVNQLDRMSEAVTNLIGDRASNQWATWVPETLHRMAVAKKRARLATEGTENQ
jgi:hypothetical protein